MVIDMVDQVEGPHTSCCVAYVVVVMVCLAVTVHW